MGSGREAHKGEDICMHIVNSLYCTAESDSIVNQLHANENKTKQTSKQADVYPAAAAAAKSHQSYATLCDPIDHSPTGSSVHRILQARTLEWVPFPSPDLCPGWHLLVTCSFSQTRVPALYQVKFHFQFQIFALTIEI